MIWNKSAACLSLFSLIQLVLPFIEIITWGCLQDCHFLTGPAADCLPKKGQRKVRITIPTNCVKCLSDIKGQCAQCQVKELKRLLKIKDRLLQNKVKQLKRLQAKSDIRHRKMKLKLIEARRKLNTSRNRLFRMKKYANVISTYFGL